MSFLKDLPRLNAVRIGALYFKSNAITDRLAQFVRLVVHEFVHEGDSAFSVGGSCTLVSFRGSAFVVTTRHQLKVPIGNSVPLSNLETLRFATIESGVLANILVDRCFFETSNPTEEFHDLLFFKVQSTWLSNSPDRADFFPLDGSSGGRRRVSTVFGYPFSKSEFEYQPGGIHIRQACIDGTLDESFGSSAQHLRRYTYPKAEYEVNGFSGGAVFSLTGDMDAGWAVDLDGIIVRGGGGYLYVVDADYVREALMKYPSRDA